MLSRNISECSHHGMENWLLMQNFYHGLTNSTRETMDTATGGAFLSLTIPAETALMEKIGPPIKAGMKNVFKPTREVEVCIKSRR